MAKKDKNLAQEGLVFKTRTSKGGEDSPSSLAKTKYDYILKNKKSRKASKQKQIVTIASIVISIVLIGVGVFYGMYMAIKLNSFKVYVDSPGNKILSLSYSEQAGSGGGTEVLEISGPNFMDNTSLSSTHNKSDSTAIFDKLELIINSEDFVYEPQDSFIAASFFLWNRTGEDQEYTEQLNLRNATRNVERAVRVMLIRNYDITVYGMLNSNGEQDEVVPLGKEIYTPLQVVRDQDGNVIKDENGDVTIEQVGGDEPWMALDFHRKDDGRYSDYVFYNEDLTISADDYVRYSIIIWLEGNDEDCVDDKLGGIIQMDFAFVQKKK